MDEREIWDNFYGRKPRAWRGSGNVPDLNLSEGSRILDAGCGNGKTCSRLIEFGFDVTGMDFSPNAIESCSEIYGNKAVFITGDCLKMPFPEDTFDGIYAVHITEHFDDSEAETFSSECFRILKPDGRLFVRSFSPDDMRSGNPVREGIRYRYRRPEEITALFSEFFVLESKLINETTRFDTVRSRSECVFSKPF